MLLLIAPAATAEPLADLLRREFDFAVHLADGRRAALALLRRTDFTLLLLDESISTLDPEGTDIIYQHAGAAAVLELNFTISSAPRILRQVRAALVRRAQDEATGRAAAASILRGEVNASLTGILLETQLALLEATPAQASKLRHLVELADDLRRRLGAA